MILSGSGAGLRTMISVTEAAPEVSVAIVSKVYPMRSHTVSAEGAAAAVVDSDDSLDGHAYDTISGGDWLRDQDPWRLSFKRHPPRGTQRITPAGAWGMPMEPNHRWPRDGASIRGYDLPAWSPAQRAYGR